MGLSLGLAISPAPACKRPAVVRDGRQHAIRVGCSTSETEALFSKRIREKGWVFPPKDPHPLVAEAWRAMDQIYSAAFETPLEPSPWLADKAEAVVCLKMETKQATGSFKARGAVHKVLSLTPGQLAAGLTTSSTGNHALAVLHAAHAVAERTGRAPRLTIYLPSTASPAKVQRLREAGAEVVFHGEDCVEAEREARRAAERQQGAVYISPYNDHQVAGGQGTLGVELLMQVAKGQLDTVFVPVGGGGLVSGIAAVLKAASPAIQVVGCQPEASDVMRRSVEEGRVVDLPWRETLSDGTAGGLEEGSVTLEPCTQFVDEWVSVGETEIAKAMVDMYSHHGVLVEGAAGVALAAFLRKAPEMKGKKCVVVVCGGNVSKETMDRAYKLVHNVTGWRKGLLSLVVWSLTTAKFYTLSPSAYKLCGLTR